MDIKERILKNTIGMFLEIGISVLIMAIVLGLFGVIINLVLSVIVRFIN